MTMSPKAMSAVNLSAEETRRYGRHLILPEVGPEGQRRLKAARVLLVGAGGLGSPLALYLAAAGVGRIGIVDFDVVDESNLQRQLLHGTRDVGRPKTESAAARLAEVNPHVEVVAHRTRLDATNAGELLAEYELVADGSDNFGTRYLINDACVFADKPNVWGAVFQFEGQVSVFHHAGGPCYRCLYPEPPPPGAVPSCAEAGVLGVLPGIIGLLQANEVIKVLLGVGEVLSGRMLLFDALSGSFREVRLKRRPDCPVCGATPSIRTLQEAEGYCASPNSSVEAAESDPDSHSISVAELASRRKAGSAPLLLDVRLPQELAIVQLPGATHIPLHELPRRLGELDASAEIAVMCHHGGRSAQAVNFLLQRGFRRPRNVDGGIDRYAREVDPSLPRY